MNKVILNKIYKLKNVNIKQITNKITELVLNNNIVYAINNEGLFYYGKNNKIVIEDIVIKKDFMSATSKYNIPSFFNTKFKRDTLQQLIAIYTMENEIWREYVWHFDLVFYPFIVYIEG